MSEYLLAHGSYLLIVVVLVLTGSGLPIPEEVPIIAAGVLSSTGQMHPGLAFAACLVGAILGDCVMYAIGRHFGRSVVREHPLWAHFVKPDREARIEQMLQAHGLKVFFLARFLVGLRSPVYLAAGVLRVPFRRFFLMDLLCATSVIGTFFGLSYTFGETITGWIRRAEILLTVVVVAVLIGVSLYFWRRLHRHIEQEAFVAEEPEAEQMPAESEEIGNATQGSDEHDTRELAEQV